MEKLDDIEQEESKINVPQLETKVKANKVGKEFIYFSILSLCFGFIFMFSFYDFDRNFNGIFYPIFVIALFCITIIAFRKLNIRIHKGSYLYVVVGIMLGISSFITMNIFTVFFNTIGIIILYGLFIVKNYYSHRTFGPVNVVSHMFGILFESINNIPLSIKHILVFHKPKKMNKSKLIPIIQGIGLGIVFLCIVIPLLSSSDLIFAKLMGKILPRFFMPFGGGWFYYVILTMIGSFLFYGLLCTISEEKVEDLKSKEKDKLQPVSILIMTWFVTVVYVLFCIIQIVYLIGGNFFELPGGITYAVYARRGFFQLVAVVTMNILLVLLSVSRVKEHKYLDLSLKIISGCTFIMIASATYRMILYINVYHFTFLRLLVLWFLVVLTFFMVGNVYYIYHKNFFVYRYIFFTGLFLYLIFAFMRPDYIVAKYNINHMEQIQIQDLSYLLRLSEDAAPAIAKIREEQYSDGFTDGAGYESSQKLINTYYNYIYSTHKNSIRSFNVSRYLAFNAIKEYVK